MADRTTNLPPLAPVLGGVAATAVPPAAAAIPPAAAAAAASGTAAAPPATATSVAAAAPPAAGRGGGRGGGGRRGGGRGGGRGGTAGRGAGRTTGKPNYKNNILINIIEEVLPCGNDEWEKVAAQYREESEEIDFRDVKDMKLHWQKRLCNNYKKPTGKMGEPGNRINRCNDIANAIEKKHAAGVLGASSAEEECKEDNYASSGMEDISFGGRDEEDDGSIGEYGEGGAPTAVTAVVEGGAPTAVTAVVEGGAPTAVNNASLTTQQRPRSRSSTISTGSSSGNKTKNSSNRDRTSVAKSIQSLTTAMTDRVNNGGNYEGGGLR